MGFDETDFERLYFSGINLQDAHNILIDEEEGVFLIRDSSRGGYVLCVKEKDEVSQYPIVLTEKGGEKSFHIREDCPFTSLTSLLSFYKRNIFKTSALKRPVSSERVILRRSTREGSEVRGFVKSEIPSGHMCSNAHAMRRSAPPDVSKAFESSRMSQDYPPRYARVIKAREPSPYTKDLPLRKDDIIKVIGSSMKAGMGRGELNGQVGEFPLINVEFVNLNNPK